MDTLSLNTGTQTGLPAPRGCIPFAFPGLPHIGCFFSSAVSGNIAVFPDRDTPGNADAVRNRKSMLSEAGIPAWVELLQVHKDHMVVGPGPTALEEASRLEGDGSCTDRPGIALLVKTADCQPILLTDRQGKAVAALHVGWRGNAIDFPASGLARFCDNFGIAAADVLAVRGPSLGPGASEFVNFAEEWPAEFLPWYEQEKKTMDLWSLTRHQLVQAGMRPEHIFSLDLCTHSLPGLFFSYRRGNAGRQASVIWIRA